RRRACALREWSGFAIRLAEERDASQGLSRAVGRGHGRAAQRAAESRRGNRSGQYGTTGDCAVAGRTRGCSTGDEPAGGESFDDAEAGGDRSAETAGNIAIDYRIGATATIAVAGFSSGLEELVLARPRQTAVQ